MKQLIVLSSTILLGVFIYGLIMGDSDSSIINAMSSVWEANVEARKLNP
jgi:hypothetical protein